MKFNSYVWGGIILVIALSLALWNRAEAVKVALGAKTHPITLTYYLPEDRPAACVTAGLVKAAYSLSMTVDGVSNVTIIDAVKSGLDACGLPNDELITVPKLPEWLSATVAGFSILTETGSPCEFEKEWFKDGVQICEPSPESDE